MLESVTAESDPTRGVVIKEPVDYEGPSSEINYMHPDYVNEYVRRNRNLIALSQVFRDDYDRFLLIRKHYADNPCNQIGPG